MAEINKVIGALIDGATETNRCIEEAKMPNLNTLLAVLMCASLFNNSAITFFLYLAGYCLTFRDRTKQWPS